MFEFTTNREDISAELMDVIRSFLPLPEETDYTITHSFEIEEPDKKRRNNIRISDAFFSYVDDAIVYENSLEYTRLDLRNCKLSLYKALSAYFKRDLPWGSLTGIRPTKPAYQLLEAGNPMETLDAELVNRYLLSPEKAELTKRIIQNQSACIYERMSLCADEKTADLPFSERLYNLYIHVPFCPTKCRYCSFVTTPVYKQKWLVQPYIDALCDEIRATAEQMEGQGLKLFSVYVGGGTPTAISANQLNQLLSALPYGEVEITCEAGRPDTIDEEKLQVLAENGVNRISVNPQTLNDETLKRIGRNHTVDRFLAAYEQSRKFGFRINVDLIAGLEGETLDVFKRSVDGVIALKPENITVHTLSRKRGSQLIQSDYKTNDDIEAMVAYSIDKLSKARYLPYYLYRQKQMLGNLENIGWARENMQCVNNITTMEETLSVAACGAGAISKKIYASGRIERLANVRDVMLYLDQFDERLKKKQIFFAN